MLSKIRHTLWGELTRGEVEKYGLLSAVFFLIIGAYWMMREMKSALFMHIIGPQGLPYAKLVSITSLVVLILFYNKLVDVLERNKLIYFLTTFYGLLFLSFAYFLTHPTIGIANEVAHKGRLFGWIMYVAIESFGSLVVAAFWSFVASFTDTASAKKGYPIIVAGAQFGSIIGSTFLMMNAKKWGLPVLMVIASVGVLCVPLMLGSFIRRHPRLLAEKQQQEHKKATGIFEGLRLLFSHPYLLGILVVSISCDVITTIFDILMNSTAKETLGNLESVTEFLGMYGVATNCLSFLFVFAGTSFFIRRFGLTRCLIFYPIMLAIAVCAVWYSPTLLVFCLAQIVTKGLSYALNNPCKEIMYIPTSRDIKFKAKSWIDVQGSRSAKGFGATIATFFPVLAELAVYGSIISLGIIAFWIPVALFVGRTNNKLVTQNKIIE